MFGPIVAHSWLVAAVVVGLQLKNINESIIIWKMKRKDMKKKKEKKKKIPGHTTTSVMTSNDYRIINSQSQRILCSEVR